MKRSSVVAVAAGIVGALALGSSSLFSSCAGNADKDADGFFGESALCGGPLFDCNEDDRSVGNGDLFFCDNDADGYGDPSATVYACTDVECDAPPCVGVTNALDCDDNNASVEASLGIQIYPDCDGDSLGDPSRSILFCRVNNDQVPEQDFNGCPYVLNGDDCDDTGGTASFLTQVWLDCDADGYGDEITGPFRVCSNAFNLADTDEAKACLFATQGGDCKDGDGAVNPVQNPEGNTCPDEGDEGTEG